MDSKEVAVVKDLGKGLVAFDEDLGFSGFEGTEGDAGSFAIPFLKVLQALSPARTEGTDEYIEDSKNGDFFNSVTEEVYGRNFNAIIVTTERVFNEYKPNRGGFVGTHDRVAGEALIRDKSEYPFINKKTGNNLVETLTFILLNADKISDGPIIFSLSSTSLKHGKAFLSKAKMLLKEDGAPAPLYSSVYNFETKLQSNDEGKWWQVIKSSMKRTGSITAVQVQGIVDAFNLFKAEGVDYAKNEEDKQTEMDFGDENTSKSSPF